MKLVIDENISRSFPELRIGIIIAKDIDNQGNNLELQEIKKDKAAEFRKKYSPTTLLENPYVAVWRNVYRSFGINPKDNKPTAEALLRRLLQGNEIPTISKVVDLYLIVETEFYLPIGGYDLNTIKGSINLRYSLGNESFIPLGSFNEEKTRPGEIVYADEERILTRKWNFRDCDACKITQASSYIALFTEAPLATISTEHLDNSLTKIKEYMTMFCGGEISTIIADIHQGLSWELM